MIMPKKSRPSIAIYNIIVLVTITTTTTTTTSLLHLVKANDYVCDLVDCVNGMFSQAKCACECIPPFCPDEHGDCIVAGTCDDPWEGCEMGENCPWWDNPSKAESCDTGPLVRKMYTVTDILSICPSTICYSVLLLLHHILILFLFCSIFRFRKGLGTSSPPKRFAVKQSFHTLLCVTSHQKLPHQRNIPP